MNEEMFLPFAHHGLFPSGTTKYADTPEHYLTPSGDLYDIFIHRYGKDYWLQHAKMECIQYLDRAGKKDHLKDDIQKVIVICERILKEYE